MANYIAEFPIDPATDGNVFLQRLTTLATSRVLLDEEMHEAMTFSIVHSAEHTITALFKYESVEHERRWHTSALITRNDENSFVRVEVLPLDKTAELYRPQKPLIIDVLLDALDSTGTPPFKATSAALNISNKFLPHCERLVKGTSNAYLPVFYATKDFIIERKLDQDDIAKRLYGLAHVFIEGDKYVRRNLQKRLKTIDNANTLWPACLLWPCNNGATHPPINFYSEKETGVVFINSLENTLQDKANNSELCNKSAWLMVSDVLFDACDTPRSNAPAVTLQTAPVTASKQKSTQAIQLKESANDTVNPHCLTLQYDDSRDLESDELLEIVLDAINDSLKQKLASDPDKGNQFKRRVDILKALLDSNSLPVKPLKEKKEKVDRILRGKRGIDKPSEQALAKIGIRVTHGGKHPKLSLEDSKRYVTTAPSTSSDSQSWKNLVAEIGRKFF